MNKIFKSIVISTLILSGYGCSSNITNPTISTSNVNTVNNSKYLLTGKVQFPDRFKTKANITDVAKVATVSIISNNQTIATGLSDDTGSFMINFNTNFNPATTDIFILQATRRVNTNENISLSTFIKWDGTNWKSITQPQLLINDKTTAITIISTLTPDVLPAASSINSIDNSNNTINNIGTITSDKIIQVASKVSLLIKKDNDPLSKIKFVNNDYIIDYKVSLAEFILSGTCNYCSLEGSNLSNTNMDYVDLSNSLLNNSNLSNSKLVGASFIGASIKNANLNNIDISNSQLKDTDFSNTEINNSDFNSSTLLNTIMTNTKLNNTKMNDSNIKSSNFSHAEMKGINLSNSKILDSNFSNVDFSQNDTTISNLSKTNIKNVNFTASNLSYSNLSYSVLENVNFSNVNLSNSNLSHTFLGDITLTNTNMTNTNLSYSDLDGLDISTVNLTGADLSNAIWIDGTTFGENKICGANSIGQCNE